MAHVAHVAHISESEVVVEASLAGPVTNSFLDLFVSWGLWWAALFFFALSWGFSLSGVFLLKETFLLGIGSLVWRHCQVVWHSFAVISILWLLASVALLSSLEVIVLALAAFPSTIWELEFVSLINLRLSSLFDNRLGWCESGESWSKGLMKRLDTSSRFSH